MARTRTLEQLIDAVRRNTDNRDSQEWITDDELKELINEELAELHARMTANEGQPHFRSQHDIPISAGTAVYPLPADFYKVQEVVASIDGINQALVPFMPRERADLLNSQFYLSSFRDGPRYRVQGDNIEVLPATRDFTLSLFYTRACPRLEDPSDTTDGFDGYEVSAVFGASATVREMERMDSSLYANLKMTVMQRIDAQSAQRDASAPERVVDVTGALDFCPTGWWT
jgi:hypothetical protein